MDVGFIWGQTVSGRLYLKGFLKQGSFSNLREKRKLGKKEYDRALKRFVLEPYKRMPRFKVAACLLFLTGIRLVSGLDGERTISQITCFNRSV